MTRGRHSLAPQKSKHRRLAYLAAPLVTSAVVGVGVVASGSTGGSPSQIDVTAAAGDLGAAAPAERVIESSRDQDRTARTARKAVTKLINPTVTARRWTTTALDLRATPAADARVLGEVKAVSRLGITGEVTGDYAQVVIQKDGSPTIAWVTAAYLVAKKPENPAELPLSDAPCPDVSVEHGLTSGAIRLYRAVCHAFPQATQYGGWDAHGEHASGKALDIMTSDVALGNAIAAFLQAHASELDLYDIIWRQHIWTPERASEGWRSMSDRGSETANHYDHVHASVN